MADRRAGSWGPNGVQMGSTRTEIKKYRLTQNGASFGVILNSCDTF